MHRLEITYSFVANAARPSIQIHSIHLAFFFLKSRRRGFFIFGVIASFIFDLLLFQVCLFFFTLSGWYFVFDVRPLYEQLLTSFMYEFYVRICSRMNGDNFDAEKRLVIFCFVFGFRCSAFFQFERDFIEKSLRKV